MKIIELKAENFKRLTAVEIKPEESDSLVMVTGKNEQGKSSVLDAIWSALDGKAIPQKPIKKGKEKAEIVVNLGNYIVKRTFSKKGNYLTVTDATGKAKFNSPQALLKEFIGDLSFDPLGFIGLSSKKQSDVLRKLVKLELLPDEIKIFDKQERDELESTADPFPILNRESKKNYEERTFVNRELKNFTTQLMLMPNVPETHKIDISKIMKAKRILEAEAFEQKKWEMRKENKEASLNEAKELYSRLLENPGVEVKDEKIIKLEKQIKKLQQKIMSLRQQKMNYQQKQREISSAKNKVATIKKEYEDIISSKLSSVDPLKLDQELIQMQSSLEKAIEQNKTAERYEKRFDISKKAKEKKEISDSLTEKIETIENIKQNMLKRAKMPISGLCFDEDGVTFRDIPISQCSSSESLKIACAIGMAINPTLKVILIRDGSLLDSDNLKILRDMAKLHDFQVWIEKVDETGKIGFYIEDGGIVKVGGKNERIKTL